MTRSLLPCRRRRGVTYVDVLVILAIVLLVIPVALFVLIPARHRGESASRVKCASNLKQIGLAILLYSNENRGQYPRAFYLPGPDVKPVWRTGTTSSNPFTGPDPNDVTAAMFLLLRTQDITSEVFVCPDTAGERDWFGQSSAGPTTAPVNRANFTDVRKNLTYSILNPYPSEGVLTEEDKAWWWTNRVTYELPIAADINPGVLGGDDDVTKPNVSSSSTTMKLANSNNHDGDGHVEFLQNPFVGVQRDNIYTNRNGAVVASPVDANDTVLLPTDD